jgi:hypothetical protein
MAGVSEQFETTTALRARGRSCGRRRHDDDGCESKPMTKKMEMNARSPAGAPDAPTRWWKSMPSDLRDAASLEQMKAAAAEIPLPGGTRWRRAAAGEAPAAIGIVLEGDRRRMCGRKLDLAMTLLAICALEGNDAACVVLSHAIRRVRDAGPAEARIAMSWLAFRKVLERGSVGNPSFEDGDMP